MFRYDAAMVCEMLDMKNTCDVSLPQVPGNEHQILLWHPGCNLSEIEHSPLGEERLLSGKSSFDYKQFTASAAYYVVQLCVPYSECKNWREQLHLIGTVDYVEAAPVSVAALALALVLKDGANLLEKNWIRCAEPMLPGFRARLAVYESRVFVGQSSDGIKANYMRLAACRKLTHLAPRV